ncbi:hypothetical protein Acor_40690 [Acrocarpospora corrugata]|uniref:Uncharacterized protein n=1 Tax=Acrocarpospora corrugata TaxID=35763 RepID=A0A5M3VZX4_9ACTN|nr:hypothetical protein [Acrocarpospora corrugata]GES02004.1 hypothetical protein Acor_40690 [Acrocarpospora corrugata]
MTTPGVDQIPSVANDVSHASDLRAAARWLVGGSASIVAVLVANLQFRNLDGLEEVGAWAVMAALSAILTALTSVVWVLYRAAGVLAVPRRSIGELSELDRSDNGGFPGRRLESPKSALMKYLVVERRNDLLGASRDAIGQLSGDHIKAYKATTINKPGDRVRIGTNIYDLGDSAAMSALTSLSLDLGRRVQCVVDAAAAFETQQRYDRLAKGLKWAGAPFVASLLVLLLLPTLVPDVMQVKVPTRVQIASPASWPTPCAGMLLDGIAVGGNMDAPIVVIPRQGNCPAQKLTETAHLIVIPKVD